MTNVNDLLHRAASGLGEHASDCPDCHATARDIDEYLDFLEPAASVPDGFPSSTKPYEGSLPDRLTRLEGVVRKLLEYDGEGSPAAHRVELLRDLKEAE